MTATLSVEGLEVRLGGRAVLSGLDIRFEPGRVTCVIGANGAGKSTLLACLAGLRRPDAGEARLDGQPVLALPARLRAQRIGFLPQTPEIAWALEVETLVGLGRTPFLGGGRRDPEGPAAVARAMILTGTDVFAGRAVTTLSGGERGRALIARALAGEPLWLLADEPLTGLDPGHQLDACDLFRRLAKEQGRGVVMTLHDLPMALRAADWVVVLNDGRLLAEGPPAEALSSEVLRRAYGVETRLAQGPAGPHLELLGRSGG